MPASRCGRVQTKNTPSFAEQYGRYLLFLTHALLLHVPCVVGFTLTDAPSQPTPVKKTPSLYWTIAYWHHLFPQVATRSKGGRDEEWSTRKAWECQQQRYDPVVSFVSIISCDSHRRAVPEKAEDLPCCCYQSLPTPSLLRAGFRSQRPAIDGGHRLRIMLPCPATAHGMIAPRQAKQRHYLADKAEREKSKKLSSSRVA